MARQQQERVALQIQRQISMLSTKLFQEDLAKWLLHQHLTQETCPPELLQKFKFQCLNSAKQKFLQLRQHQQHLLSYAAAAGHTRPNEQSRISDYEAISDQ